MNLTENFTLEEFYNSTTADKYGIDNFPHNIMIRNNIVCLAILILQKIRDVYGKPITVTSGYRCEMLNKKVGGSTTSQHMLGQAADITCKDNAKLFKIILDMIDRGEIECGQLIWEYGNDKQPDWIHISSPNKNNHNKIMKAKKVNGKTTYSYYR